MGFPTMRYGSPLYNGSPGPQGTFVPLSVLKRRTSSKPATWSMCAWVSTTASTLSMPYSMHARRISGGVSTRNAVPSSATTYAPHLRRLSRGSGEVHTLHLHPICGTPTEVPVPRNMNFIASPSRRTRLLRVPGGELSRCSQAGQDGIRRGRRRAGSPRRALRPSSKRP